MLLTRNASVLLNEIFPMALAKGMIRSALGSIRIPEAKGTQDYFGFNYYTKNRVTFDLRDLKQCSAMVFLQKMLI